MQGNDMQEMANKYLTSLRERHSLKYKKRKPDVEVGEVVVIICDERSKAQCKLR